MAGVSFESSVHDALTDIMRRSHQQSTSKWPGSPIYEEASTINIGRSSLFRRNTVFLATVFAGAFAFEV